MHLQVNYSEEVDASAIRVEKVASTAVDSLDMETEDFGEGINDGNFLKKKKKKLMITEGIYFRKCLPC